MDINTALGVGSAVAGIGTTALGIESNKKASKRQYENQRKLNEQGKDLALQMWKDTNYSAQGKELEKAGLNKGLLYGMSGGGATTANAGSGGSAQAQQGGDFSGSVGMGLQATQIANQNKLMEAQADNLEADTENKRGVQRDNVGADTANKQATTALTNMQTANQEILNTVNSRSMEDVIGTIEANYKKAEAEAGTAIVGARIASKSENDIVKQRKGEAINTMLQAGAIKAGINLSTEQAKKISDDIAQGYINAYSNQRNANSNEQNSETNTMKQIKDALYQSGILEQGDRKLTQDMILGIGNILKPTGNKK